MERKKSEKREQDGLSPEQGTKLYEPEYEEKQRFTHNTFLKEILQQKQGKSQGKRISLIGEPGAGKTTLLQTIASWILEQKFGLPVWVSLADLTLDGNLRSLENYLLNSWLPFSPNERQKVQENFTEQFKAGRVWLLLDGVDEIATSGSQTLQNISRQLSGWVGKARVVLTCRLNVWQADVNALSDFETFRLLDFDYPQQVHQFIDNWFNPSHTPHTSHTSHTSPSSRLKEELGKEEKARVRDLVQNPLRLALLCRSWQLYEGSLPETKAELYSQFVEQFYRWKSIIFPIKKSKQRELNLALGRLAKDDIDSSGGRFRLRQDFIVERLGDTDDENSLFYLALQIGWLNNVGVAAESPTKKVYAFFHASFEEYFAAVAIADWDFFLPRKHKNKPVKGRRYRIFEPQWEQVILLWLGREDVEEEEKEGFIQALTKFRDGCGTFLIPGVDRGFYGYEAYFLAAAGITEFSKCTQADKIVKKVVDWCFRFNEVAIEGILPETPKKVVDWGFGYNKIAIEAKAVLTETPRKNTINALVQLLGSTCDGWIRYKVVESLEKIGRGNEKAINALVQLLGCTSDVHSRREVAESLWKINPGNKKVIDTFVHLLESTSDDRIRCQAVLLSIEKICMGNKKAIDALIQLLGSTSDSWICMQAAESLGKIDPGNDNAINALVHLLESTDINIPRFAAESLGKINPGNENAINTLVHLLGSTSCNDTHWLAARSLRKIGMGNENVINALVQLLGSTSDGNKVQWRVAENLGEIGTGNKKAIDGLVQLLEFTSDDYTCRKAAESLGQIDPGNKKAIDALVHFLESTSDNYTCVSAAQSLGQIDPGNENAINALVQLLESTSDYNIQWLIVESLGEIGTGNKKAIDALANLLGSTSDDSEIQWRVAQSLGRIDPGNEKAIYALVQFLRSTSNYDLLKLAAESLGEIGKGNEKAINGLLHLLGSNSDYWTPREREVAESLEKILVEKQMAEVITSVVTSLKGYIDNSDRFHKCYEIIWKCAQTLPYPEFYQAWHSSSKLKKPR
ncbi:MULTISPECIES: HEAT repeat domain-containing protein [unclassified Okeania]|uniref:HEAT repeat domain-containing protein n=1 Tax=unclassified Okeania TaxID=2634635 RepID=UPI00257B5FD3|nr:MULTISPECIES: HEAT repeat domain-containing protein [unclassified Okeania]